MRLVLVADDKAIYSYVDKMIKFYLDEEPKLKQVQTFLCRKKIHKDHVIENISKLVVKPTNGSGGNGILIGPQASKEEREKMINKIKSKPDDYIAQPCKSFQQRQLFLNLGYSFRFKAF